MKGGNMKDIKPKEIKPTAQEFAKEYQKLCEEMGYRVVVTPVWASTNHGSFEMSLQTSVGELPKKE